MKKVSLYIPKEEDLWFREACMSDPKTMEYNAGYEVSYEGYHYDTGCIDFPKSKWKTWHDEKIKQDKNLFYAYIKDEESENFVGYVNFKIDRATNKASMGIVINSKFKGMGYMRPAMSLLIEKAKEMNVVALTDAVPETREIALKVFFDLGFEIVGTFTHNKFKKAENVLKIEKKL